MIYLWMLIICLSLLGIADLDKNNNNTREENNKNAIRYLITFFVLLICPVFMFDVSNDEFNRPLKQNIHVKLKNGEPIDTIYTYE